MKVKLKNIKPNPFRDMDAYPIDEAKVDALAKSFKRTGYWGNIVARQNGNGVEIAYGHHRLITMRRTMKPSADVEMIVRDISDADILRMMADENMDEWHTSSEVEQETIRAVVLAYAAGKIELPKVPGKVQKSNIRYAPNYTRGCSDTSSEHPYTDQTIADFLGWTFPNGEPSRRVRNALHALEAAEELDAPEEMAEITKGLSSEQAKVVVTAVKDVKKSHENAGRNEGAAKKKALTAGKKIAEKARKGASVREIREQKEQFKPKEPKKADKLPDISEYVEAIAGDLDSFFRGDDTANGFSELMKHKAYIGASDQKRLVKILRGLASRCEQAAQRLEGKTVGTKAHLLEN